MMKPSHSVGYQERDEILMRMGFPSYTDYLQSDLWKGIREAALERCNHRCKVCRGVATAVHHNQYNRRTLEGKRPKFLVALCNGCHYKIEFDVNGLKHPAELVFAILRRMLNRRRSRPEIGLRHKEKWLARR